MWPKAYKDYPVDTPLIQTQVEPSNGIVGCEMHDINGWGNTLHISSDRRLVHFSRKSTLSKMDEV